MAKRFDRFIESLLFTFAPFVFAGAGLFQWLARDDATTAIICGAIVIILVFFRFRPREKS